MFPAVSLGVQVEYTQVNEGKMKVQVEATCVNYAMLLENSFGLSSKISNYSRLFSNVEI